MDTILGKAAIQPGKARGRERAGPPGPVLAGGGVTRRGQIAAIHTPAVRASKLAGDRVLSSPVGAECQWFLLGAVPEGDLALSRGHSSIRCVSSDRCGDCAGCRQTRQSFWRSGSFRQPVVYVQVAKVMLGVWLLVT